MKNRHALRSTILALAATFVAPLTSADEVTVRVVDTGPGLCTVASMPDDHYMVYDAGHWQREECLKQVRKIVPSDEPIDLLILSHTDADHLGDAEEILHAYTVNKIVHTGQDRLDCPGRKCATWKSTVAAIEKEVSRGAQEINLSQETPTPGYVLWEHGDTSVTFLAGWNKAPEAWGVSRNASLRNNAISIVVRLQHADGSVLFTGDALGRNDEVCPAVEPVWSEKYMLDHVEPALLDSDVIIAGHHGADDASSGDFIRAVSPTYVVFSAGHDHEHPRETTANRYLTLGVSAENMFRTDRDGRREGPEEWCMSKSRRGETDKSGDDHVDIRINASGELSVTYDR